MKSRVIVMIACLVLNYSMAPPALAQRHAPVKSPETHEDGRVTFRLRATTADSVDVVGYWPDGQASMKKGADDIWEVTLGPIPPGVWAYSLHVDGVAMIDPGNSEIKPTRSPRFSTLYIAADPPSVLDLQHVDSGVLHLHTYRSKSLGRFRDLLIYTPPGYARERGQTYPTLYLQHGRGDTYATWTAHAKAHWIVDNLIAQGRVRPMVIVMMDGHAAPFEADSDTNTKAFEGELLQDVMPLVESEYRLRRDASHRALVGLSMGGGQSLTIGLSHPELFAWVGAFSAAAPDQEFVARVLKDPDQTNRLVKLLWIACGRDDFLLEQNKTFVGHLKDQGIRHEWYLTDGNHSWPVWRTYLSEILPRLFQ